MTCGFFLINYILYLKSHPLDLCFFLNSFTPCAIINLKRQRDIGLIVQLKIILCHHVISDNETTCTARRCHSHLHVKGSAVNYVINVMRADGFIAVSVINVNALNGSR